MTGTNIYILPTLKIDLSYHPFIKDDIFEVNVNLPPRGIVAQYCENHNMSYIYQSQNNIPWNCYFTARNGTNFWILSIYRKGQTTVQQVLKALSRQQLTGKCNRAHVITS